MRCYIFLKLYLNFTHSLKNSYLTGDHKTKHGLAGNDYIDYNDCSNLVASFFIKLLARVSKKIEYTALLFIKLQSATF